MKAKHNSASGCMTASFRVRPRIAVAPLLCIAIACSFAFAQESGQGAPTEARSFEADNLPLELRFTSVPRTAAEAAKALDELTAELDLLAPTSQPATSQPTTQPDAEIDAQLDGWRLELWKALLAFREQLAEVVTQSDALQTLSQDAEVVKITEAINELKRKTGEVQESPVPFDIAQAVVDEARTGFEQNSQTLDALAATLSQQEALLRDGFAAQRARLQDDLRAVQTEREKFEASYEVEVKAADSEAVRALVESRCRVIAARAATLETARVVLELKEKRTQQEFERNKLRHDALRPYVTALRERMNALIESRSRSRADRLRARLEQVDLSPIRRVFLQMQLLNEENVVRLQQKFADAIRQRYQASSVQALATGAARDERYWKEFGDSLSRRTAAEILTAYQDARIELERARQRYSSLLSLLDQSFSEERAILQASGRVIEEYSVLEAVFRELAGSETDEETIKLTQQVGQTRLELRNAFEDVLKSEQEVIERLRKALEIARANVALWEGATSRLYWIHLITRGPIIFDSTAFRLAREETSALWDGRLARVIRDAVATVRRRTRSVVAPDWVALGAASMVILYVALRCFRGCRRIRDEGIEPVEAGESAEAPAPPFVRRLRYHLARAAIVPIPIVAVLALAVAFAETVGLVGVPRRLAYWLVLTLGGLVAGLTVINVAFTATKPRYRLISCSRTVARYYRRFGLVFIWFSFVGLGLAYLGYASGLAVGSSRPQGEWFHFIINVLVFLFLLRRETVLSVFPRTERGRLAVTVTTLRTLYPVLLAVSFLLVLMHVIGYKALATYISIGLASTVGLILSAWVFYELVHAFLLRIIKRLAHARASSETTPAGEPSIPVPTTDKDQAAGDSQVTKEAAATGPRGLPPGLNLILGIIRWALIAAVVIVSLSVWGIRPYEIKQILDLELWRHGDRPISAWRLGGTVLAIVVAVVFSRALRQALQSRIYPHHPAIDRGAQAAIDTLLHYVIIAVGIYAALQTLQLDFGALVVLFGGLGLGLGLGLQPLIVNFISGLFMLFERHVKVGDVVVVHDKLGEITKVSMRSTTVRTPDGVNLIIPNGEFINQKVENWTLDNKPIRGQVNIGVAYGTDPKRVKELLLELAFAEAKVRLDPPPDVFFTDFGESSLNFTLACWFNNPPERWFGMLSLRYAISEKFRAEGIEIPFPQRTLSLISDKPLQVQVLDYESFGPRPPADPAK